MPDGRRGWPVLVALLLAALAAYQPAWHGDPVWDDDAHLTRPELRGVDGLRRIWLDPGATQQYYPLLHTAFWGAHRLWGDNTLGYHLLNIALHALAGFLLWLILRRLAVPWAWLPASLFVLHPVHVESVAWISELKNTLSGVLFMTAGLAYLQFDEERRGARYALAWVVFVLALATKSVTATLPAALLVVIWWRRGRIDARRDLVPLVPFGVAGAGFAAVTVWAEHTLIGARGADFDLTVVERALMAGRAVWFYAWKLLWPANLTFVYPKWTLDATVWWQYLWPLGLAGLAGLLWGWRRRTRAPVAGLAYYVLALSPALGFVSVYPFRYSYVADHFQYLASVGLITLCTSGLTAALVRRGLSGLRTQAAVALLALGPLGFLTWRQSGQFSGPEALYRATIARNPGAWLAHNNLAVLRLPGYVDDAMRHLDAALAGNPAYPEAHNNRGLALQLQRRFDDALAAHTEAVRLEPGFAEAHNNRGIALQQLGRLDEASTAYAEALRLRPGNLQGLVNLGTVRLEQGRLAEAIVLFRRALDLDASLADVRLDVAALLMKTQRPAEALAEYRALLATDAASAAAQAGAAAALASLGRGAEAILHLQAVTRLRPDSTQAHFDLGGALYGAGAFADAERAYAAAAALAPDSGDAHNNRGAALERLGRFDEAAACYARAVALLPESADARANLARARARNRRAER